MIRELYNNIVCKDFGGGKPSREMQEEISLLLKEMGESMDGFHYEKYKDNLCLIEAAAEEAGFAKGFQYAFRLFAECIQG